MIAPRVGPDIPGWDASRPLESLKAFAAEIHEKAKVMLLKDKYHSEIIFFIPLNGPSQIVQCKGADRDALVTWMRQHIRKHYIYGVIHIAESWMRIADGPNDQAVKKVAAGEMRVSELPADQRTEALVVMAQTRDGYSHTWVDTMVRDRETKGLSFGRSLEFDDAGGRLSGLFK